MKRTIGVLALQGGYASHITVFKKLGIDCREIRQPDDLRECDGLVIPGGESTVITRLLRVADAEGAGFYPALRDFVRRYPVMGTCAGLIMLARPCGDDRVESLDVLPVSVERNSYGRQTESFIQNIQINLPGSKNSDAPYPATFIRAPRITSIDANVKVLARADKEKSTEKDPVMVQYNSILGLTFHPELTPEDTRIHEYFISLG